MKESIKIKISKDFTDSPGARFIQDGPCSGEEFHNTILLPKFKEAVNKNTKLFIDLDDLWGWPSSFVSGSFGKLSQEYGAEKVLSTLELKSDDNPLRVEKVKHEINNPDQNIALAGD